MNKRITYKLGDICDDVAMGPFGSNLKVDNFITEGVPVIRGMNLHEGGFNKKNFAYVSEEKANSLKRSIAYPDDLVFTHRGTLGQVGIIPKIGFDKYLVSQSQMRLSVNKKIINPKYLYYFFKSPLGQKELLKNSSQVGVPAIANPTKSLKDVNITIPDLSTQNEIVEILTSFDNKIEVNLNMNQTLEKIAETIYKEWFIKFKFRNFNGELINGLPKGWKNCYIKDFGKIVCGKTPSKAISEYFGGEYMFMKIPDMHKSVFTISTSDSLTEVGLNSQPTKTIPPYSICVSSIATVGLVSINPKLCQTNQQINAIVPKNDFLRYYLYFLAMSMKETFLATASGGTATLNMNTSQFSNLTAVMPQNDILIEFDEIISPIMERILENTYNNEAVIKTRDIILNRLLSGNLNLKD